MAWSSGQHRSLPLQGLWVHIPALPSFFATVRRFNYETKREDDECDRFNYETASGRRERRERRWKLEGPAGERGMATRKARDGSS